MLTQEHVDKISDDFQSTFKLIPPNTLVNLFAPNEQEQVEAIIRKHYPLTKKVSFEPIMEIASDYFMWEVRVEAANVG